MALGKVMFSSSNMCLNLYNSEAICILQDLRARKIGGIMVLPWADALRKYFTVDQ